MTTDLLTSTKQILKRRLTLFTATFYTIKLGCRKEAYFLIYNLFKILLSIRMFRQCSELRHYYINTTLMKLQWIYLIDIKPHKTINIS